MSPLDSARLEPVVPRSYTLVGPDVVLLAQGGTRPNNAVFVAECDGTLDVALVRSACAELAGLAPFMSARLHRAFPWGRLHWVVGQSREVPVAHRRLDRDADIAAAIEEELNATIDPWRGPVVRWSVVESAEGGRAWLALTWVHPLMDPRGAELLVAMLDAVTRGDEGRRWAAAQLIVPPSEVRPFRVRVDGARRGVERLRAVRIPGLRSLGSEVAQAGRVRYRRRSIPAATSRPLPITLAYAAAAVASLYRRRGLPLNPAFLVPISVDRRRKGEAGPVFSNYLSFHFAHLPTAELDDIAATAKKIRAEMTEALRTDAIEGLWLGMEIALYYPPSWMFRRFKGEWASFNCADTGEVRPSFATLLNAPVRAAYHVPCVQPRPGLGIFFSRAAGQEEMIGVWIDPVVREREVDCVLDQLASALHAPFAA